MNKITIYIDGSCNNRKTGKGAREGGFGIHMIYREVERSFISSKYIKTNSARMEIMGVIKALSLCKPSKDISIEIICDNEYVVKTASIWLEEWIQQGILPYKSNYDLWQIFLQVIEKHGGLKKHNISFKWVKGHGDNVYNNLVDKLANQARLSNNIKEDIRFKNCL